MGLNICQGLTKTQGMQDAALPRQTQFYPMRNWIRVVFKLTETLCQIREGCV